MKREKRYALVIVSDRYIYKISMWEREEIKMIQRTIEIMMTIGFLIIAILFNIFLYGTNVKAEEVEKTEEIELEKMEKGEELEETSEFTESLLENIDFGETSIIDKLQDLLQVSPLWSKDEHKNMCSNSVLMKEGAGYADKKFLKACPPLHGKGNYKLNLEVLWKYASLMGQEKKKAKILACYPNRTKAEEDQVIVTCAACAKVLSLYGGGKTKKEKQDLILGFAIHLIGDTYAHDTLVDQSVLNKEGRKDTSKYVYLHKEHFYNWNDFVEDVKKSKAITRLIKTYMLEKGTWKKDKQNSVYEDEPKFMPARFSTAKQACTIFLKQWKAGKLNTTKIFVNPGTHKLIDVNKCPKGEVAKYAKGLREGKDILEIK